MPRPTTTGKVIPAAMPVEIQVDESLDVAHLPAAAELERIAAAVAGALREDRALAEVCLRICGAEESRQLNSTYRGKDKPTNVLSFPAELSLPDAPLGDLLVCWPVVVEEACSQGKSVHDHFHHLVVHGLLHLLGYDHIEDGQAKVMEALEISILDELGVSDPYFIDD